MAKVSYFREKGQNNPNFLNNIPIQDIMNNISKILIDVVYNNIIPNDYIFFTNTRLIQAGMQECEKKITSCQEIIYAQENLIQMYAMNRILNQTNNYYCLAIKSRASTRMDAWVCAYNCFKMLGSGYAPEDVFQNIKGNNNSVLKNLNIDILNI